MREILEICSNLSQGEDGIWYGQGQAVSYPADGNAACFAIEDDSFWFEHRNRCIVSAVETFPPVDGGAVFDVGGGNGYVAAGLSEAGFDVVLIEPGLDGARNARRRGIEHVICTTVEAAGVRQGSFPAVGLFDVVEHIEDDVAFLRSLRPLLCENAPLYLTVPAYSWLWSHEDSHAGHFRRYTRRSLTETLEAAGFDVLFSTYIFRFLPIPIFLQRTLPYTLGKRPPPPSVERARRDHAAHGAVAERTLHRLLEPEIARLKNRKPMRFGGSCLVVASAR